MKLSHKLNFESKKEKEYCCENEKKYLCLECNTKYCEDCYPSGHKFGNQKYHKKILIDKVIGFFFKIKLTSKIGFQNFFR